MNRTDILTHIRLAGQVRRYHTHPMLTVQTVADHSWNCCRIWYQLWGPLPPYITTYLIWHDVGEIVTGDLPFPVKSQNPILKKVISGLEDKALEDMGIVLPELMKYERVQVKCVDLIEMQEMGIHELLLGNQFAQPIIDDTYAAIEQLELRQEDGNKVFAYVARARALLKSTV